MHYTELKDAKGKSLLKSWQKTLTKLVRLGLLNEEQDGGGKCFERVNPYSGTTVSLCLFAADLADWIRSVNPYNSRNGLTRQDWDNARYVFNVCWPKEYYILID